MRVLRWLVGLVATFALLGLIAAVFAHLAFETVWAIYGWSVTAKTMRQREAGSPDSGAA